MRRPTTGPTTLAQCLEYDWALCFHCRACGHKARWGAIDLVDRFRDQLRAPISDVVAAVADHCGQRPVFNLAQGAGMMRWDGDLIRALRDPFAFRDRRLRAFLEAHGLPDALADERQAIAQAWLAAMGHRKAG